MRQDDRLGPRGLLFLYALVVRQKSKLPDLAAWFAADLIAWVVLSRPFGSDCMLLLLPFGTVKLLAFWFPLCIYIDAGAL